LYEKKMTALTRPAVTSGGPTPRYNDRNVLIGVVIVEVIVVVIVAGVVVIMEKTVLGLALVNDAIDTATGDR
jgi:hypothetical protein